MSDASGTAGSGTAGSGTDVLDEGLTRIAGTGPEFDGGLSNHAPMASEALVRLGRADVVERWLDDYLKRLDEPPAASDRITEQTWRDALGQLRRVADWEVYFRDQMAEQPWQDLLARWWPRLLPGVAAAATHGVIRTSHAVRSLATHDTAPRRAELARGLAYWAAAYLELTGSARTDGHLDLSAALGALPVAPRAAERGLITENLKAGLASQPGFVFAVNSLKPPEDAVADLGDLAREFTRVFLRYGRNRPIALLHAVTAPVAARSALPYLPAGVARPTYDALWQVGAALYAVYTGGVAAEPLPPSAPPSRDSVTEQAVATADAHAIKLTEACLRLHAESPDPVLLHAAARASELLG